MFNQNCFETFLRFGNSAEKTSLDAQLLVDLGIDSNLYEKLDLLKKLPVPTEIECPTCENYAELHYRDDHWEAVCPYCGYFRPSSWQLLRWTPNYFPLIELLYKSFNCRGTITELIPNLLWNIGRAAVTGQSREIFIACGINSWRSKNINDCLPEGLTPILIVIGDSPECGNINKISSDRIFTMSSLIKLKNNIICADITPVKELCDLLVVANKPKVRSVGKNSKIGDIKIKLKKELRQYMAGIYSAASNAERLGVEYKFPKLNQVSLSELLNTTPVMINRAIKNDELLSGLYNCANELRSAYSYGQRVLQGKM